MAIVRGIEKQVHDFFFVEALLGLLRSYMEFQQDADGFAVCAAPSLDFVQKMARIHRLHQADIRQNHLELIGLEMADEMPLKARESGSIQSIDLG